MSCPPSNAINGKCINTESLPKKNLRKLPVDDFTAARKQSMA